MKAAINEDRPAKAMLRNYRKDGTQFLNEVHLAPIHDENGKTTHFVAIESDVTQRVHHQEQIERNAHFDALSGLANRHLLNDRIDQAIAHAERSGRTLGILFLDLDHLKRINDSLGHGMGDQVITAVAQVIERSVRAGDTVARVGGDEYVVLLADLQQADDVAQVAAKVLAAVSEPLRIGAHEFVVSASIGVAMYPQDGETAEALLSNADTALYQA